MNARVLVLLLAGACAAQPVRPDDQSAQAHRTDAQRELAEAAAHERKYDPHAESHRTSRDGTADFTSSYNPTAWHHEEAARLNEHARAHQAAAVELEQFEADECKPFAPAARAACPVAGPFARVEDTASGVRYVLSDGAPVDDVLRHMRCHLAWARARGFEKLPGCPVYIKGIDVRLAADGKSIEIVGGTKALVRELQHRAHEET